jgi:hypothetical protein
MLFPRLRIILIGEHVAVAILVLFFEGFER